MNPSGSPAEAAEAGRRAAADPAARAPNAEGKRSPSAESARPRRHLVVGVVVAPRLLDDVGDRLAEDLGRTLSTKYPSVEWRATVRLDRLVAPTEPASAILDAAREALLAGGWDMGLVVTDLPLRERGRPVAHRTSRTHRIAVVSLPALGALHVRQRLRRLLLELIGELIGGGDGRGVLGEISRQVAARPAGFSVLFVPAVVLGHVRLLAGMVRANRPWRLAARLYGALVAAFAAGAYGVVTSDIWRLSEAMAWERLALMSVASIAATVTAVIVVHELWEHTPQPSVRAQVVLFNLATAVTVTIGIVTLYLTLFVLIFAGAELIVAPRVLAQTLGARSASATTPCWRGSSRRSRQWAERSGPDSSRTRPSAKRRIPARWEPRSRRPADRDAAAHRSHSGQRTVARTCPGAS